MSQSGSFNIRVFVILVAALALAGTLFGQVGAQEAPYPEPGEAAEAGVAWLLESHQNDDGGFTSFSSGANDAPSDVTGTVDALLAIGSVDGDISGPLSYLEDNIDDVVAFAAQDGSTAGKLVWALEVVGEPSRSFGGEDFVAILSEHYDPATGQYRTETAFQQSLAIIGSTLADETVPEEAKVWLVEQQDTEGDTAGSWGDGFGTVGNADSTALALMALSQAGQPAGSEAIAGALTFLSRSQLETAGWEYGPGFGENANSTALVIQALDAAGEEIAAEDTDWAVDGRTPMEALLSWQAANGAFQADFGEGRADDFFSTVQALPALAVAQDGVLEDAPTIAGGDSPLPFILLGVLAVLLLGSYLFYRFNSQP
ncbi:MAG: prenyltransferase/squalene oxidase repeat-containing protein [Candidatus Promineifilaceae bacterium]|nr:prenyltransferase/squalene oxidase repeat-containing protein [Candidatus Promineifilaceae bacterium]